MRIGKLNNGRIPRIIENRKKTEEWGVGSSTRGDCEEVVIQPSEEMRDFSQIKVKKENKENWCNVVRESGLGQSRAQGVIGENVGAISELSQTTLSVDNRPQVSPNVLVPMVTDPYVEIKIENFLQPKDDVTEEDSCTVVKSETDVLSDSINMVEAKMMGDGSAVPEAADDLLPEENTESNYSDIGIIMKMGNEDNVEETEEILK